MWGSFINLDIGGKVIAIVLYVVGGLSLILWAKFVTKRVRGGVLVRLFRRVLVSPPKQIIKDSEDSSSAPHVGQEIYKYREEAIVWQQFLSNCRKVGGEEAFCHISQNKGNNEKPHIPIAHIKKILSWLCQSIKRRTVLANRMGNTGVRILASSFSIYTLRE
jgi:hypothetical protein